MNRSFARGCLFVGTERSPHSPCAPRWQIFRVRQAIKEIPHVGIIAWINHKHRVVWVPGFLAPRIEDNFFPRVIGMQCSDQASNWVVEENRAGPDANIKLEARSVGEKRLVLTDRLALVIEYGPAAANPARAYIIHGEDWLAVGADQHLPVHIAAWHGPTLSLDLLLNFTRE